MLVRGHRRLWAPSAGLSSLLPHVGESNDQQLRRSWMTARDLSCCTIGIETYIASEVHEFFLYIRCTACITASGHTMAKYMGKDLDNF